MHLSAITRAARGPLSRLGLASKGSRLSLDDLKAPGPHWLGLVIAVGGLRNLVSVAWGCSGECLNQLAEC